MSKQDTGKAANAAASGRSAGASVDPEDLETVMFGQADLFGDEDLGQRAKKRSGSGSSQSRRSSKGSAVDRSAAKPATKRADALDTLSDADESETLEPDIIDVDEIAELDSAETLQIRPMEASAGYAAVTRDTMREPRPAAVASVEVADDMGLPRVDELSPDCRVCGRHVKRPKARRWRGSATGPAGFCCDTCGNVFCAGHAIRVSTFWESLLHGGRFRCLLCALDRPPGR